MSNPRPKNLTAREELGDYVMQFGKHKGVKLDNVPASYLLWLDREGGAKGKVLEYINENLERLTEESVLKGGY